jgi:uncharacterized protein YqfA (UPF0365 family)
MREISMPVLPSQLASSPIIAAATYILAGAAVIALLWSLLAPWLRAKREDPAITLGQVLGMKFRKVDPVPVAQARRMLADVGIDVSLSQLETQHLAGGKPLALARALVTARGAGLDLDWSLAMTMQLAGRDVESVVASAITPRDIEIPDPKSQHPRIEVPTKDGSKVRCRVKVRVRTVLNNVIGGMPEPEVVRVVVDHTILAIADATNAREVANNPSKAIEDVLNRAKLERPSCEVLGLWLTSVGEA